MSDSPSDWQSSKGLAKGMLHDRTTRRKLMARSLALLLAVFAIGLWGIDEWLAADLWRFIIWWGGCGFLALFVVVFALYDVMRVIREERDRM
jgi:peptidoglycan biosynthesis protein MviN/MurJ (putative lipid II flippase)